MEFVPITISNYHKIARIYLEGIKTGIATFETEVPDWNTWNLSHLPKARIALLVAQQIIGFAALSKVSNRKVYTGVAEVSVYVSENARGKGFGKKLLLKLIQLSEENGIWTLQSSIMRANKASIHMHLECGFRILGYREKIGQLKGVWLDNILMERRSSSF